MFKHHRYPKAIILQAVYFKLRFTLSYRDVEELLSIRGVRVDHSPAGADLQSVAGNSAGMFVRIVLYLRGLTTQNNEPQVQVS